MRDRLGDAEEHQAYTHAGAEYDEKENKTGGAREDGWIQPDAYGLVLV